MVKGYYKLIKSLADMESLLHTMQELPLSIQEDILKYKNVQDHALSIGGKLLLQQLMEDEGYERDILKGLCYEPPVKPYFSAGPNFNISHSGDLVICVVSKGSSVGVDVEQVRVTDINAYRDNFTVAEWTTINYSADKESAFYRMWVRKEALVKAIGEGMQMPLNTVDVCNDKIVIDGTPYYLYDIFVGDGYKGCVCSSGVEEVDVLEGPLPASPRER